MSEQNTQYVELPLPLGVDTATQPELVEAGRALSIRNCHVGNGALVERRNFSRLSRTATVDQGETDTRAHGEVTAILPLGSTLAIATEESRLYAPGASGTQWSEIERNEAPVSFKKALHSGTARDESSSGTHYRNPNLAIAGDWACVTWWRRSNGDDPGRGGGYALIYNMATGLTLRTERIAALIGIGTTGSTGSNPSLVPIALGSRFFVLYIDPNANEIRYKSFEPVVDTDWEAEATLVDVRAEGVDGSFDAVSTGAVAYVAYNAGLGEGVTADLTALRATASGSTLVVSRAGDRRRHGWDARLHRAHGLERLGVRARCARDHARSVDRRDARADHRGHIDRVQADRVLRLPDHGPGRRQRATRDCCVVRRDRQRRRLVWR
jgi:hypothetical protein